LPEIVLEGIRKTLGGLLTLGEISITAVDQEFIGILGPSGCGKSTLFNIISGLILPDAGRVVIDGEDFTGVTGRVSYMHQKDLLLPSCTILDNTSIPLILKGVPKRRAQDVAAEHFKQFGLAGFEHYYPSQLSGGMRQRAALLRTYLFSSDIMLLDEPFASLDAITRRKMQIWLLGVVKDLHPTVLFITHDVDEALFLCDRVDVLSECPSEVRVEVKVPFSGEERSSHIITDPRYSELRNEIMEALSI
jgi:ABC-type nitrate/sulfonate/bicarbonate transport system ATPase subunit